MNTETRTKLLESLTIVIDEWIGSFCMSQYIEDCPWLADSTPESMAQAAINVFGAIADAQKQAIEHGYLKVAEL